MLDNAVPGSVIYAQRFHSLPGITDYDHYGIYAGNNEVIHFTDDGQPPHKIELKKFISYSGEIRCYVRHFPESITALKIILRNKKISANRVSRILEHYQFFNDEETLERAEEAIGNPEWVYSVDTMNCEHFAVWCKTGIKNSSQVESLTKIIFG